MLNTNSFDSSLAVLAREVNEEAWFVDATTGGKMFCTVVDDASIG
jgi:hypothetical protein